MYRVPTIQATAHQFKSVTHDITQIIAESNQDRGKCAEHNHPHCRPVVTASEGVASNMECEVTGHQSYLPP